MVVIYLNILNDNKKILTEKNNCIPIIKYVSAKNKKEKEILKLKKSMVK